MVLIFTQTLTVILIVFLEWSYDRNAVDGMFLLFRSIPTLRTDFFGFVVNVKHLSSGFVFPFTCRRVIDPK